MLGPIQIVVIGFDNPIVTGSVVKELRAIRDKKIIRLVDLLYVSKDRNGQLQAFETSDMDEEELEKLGSVAATLLDMGAQVGALAAEKLRDTTNTYQDDTFAREDYGVSPNELQQALHEIPPGTSAAVIIFEHTWAAPLKQHIVDSGGFMVAQGMLNKESMVKLGALVGAMETL